MIDMGQRLLKEEGDLWQLITQENINISYAEAMNMTIEERACALAAILEINKRRERSRNQKK